MRRTWGVLRDIYGLLQGSGSLRELPGPQHTSEIPKVRLPVFEPVVVLNLLSFNQYIFISMCYSNRYLLNVCFNGQAVFSTKQMHSLLSWSLCHACRTEEQLISTCRVSSLSTVDLRDQSVAVYFTKTSGLKKKSLHIISVYFLIVFTLFPLCMNINHRLRALRASIMESLVRAGSVSQAVLGTICKSLAYLSHGAKCPQATG